jgi:hypothetical protein
MPAATTTNLSDVFLGSEQSRYAGIALFITILIICLSILFTSSKIPIEQRLMFVVFIIIISVPSILMSLFELTCIVTGGNYNTRWWCWLLAWVLAIMIIIYCIMIIISLFISMSNYDLANERITEDIANNNVDNANANTYAKNIMKSYEQDKQTNNRHEIQEQMQQQQQMQQSPPAQQYQPPVPPKTQYPVPQQSQHMNTNQMHSSSHEAFGCGGSVGGNNGGSNGNSGSYTGFDTTDNLSPLDSAFNTMKLPMQLPSTHNAPRMNDNVAPNDASNIDKFSLF